LNKKSDEYSSKSIIKVLLIYVYAFFVIYMPRFSDLIIGLPIEYVSVLFLCAIIIPYVLIIKQKVTININVLVLITGIFASSIYFALRAILSLNELRLMQNNFVIVQILHLVIIIGILSNLGYKKEDKIKFLLNLGLVQGLICILMIVIPGFREFALSLYYMGKEQNIYISASRIYGISGDYTFFTPAFHGILASVACIFALLKNYKYLGYVPFLLLTILLNGRIGLIVFVAGTAIGYFLILIRGRLLIKIARYGAIFVIVIMLSLLVVQIAAPSTFSWITSGLQDTVSLFSNKGLNGNYKALLDDMLYLPTDMSLLWGEGHRVFGSDGASRGYYPSDIGFVNDLFMGGIIYISILYGSIFVFLLTTALYRDYDKAYSTINKVMPFVLICTMMFSNYKGEAMRGGTILVGAILISLILREKEPERGDKSAG
jgi:hypothetical protein